MWVLWVACAPVKAPPTSTGELLAMLAGPPGVRGRPASDPLPADAPGGGPLPAYMDRLRVAVNGDLGPCVAEVDAPRSHLLVIATIARHGELVSIEVARTSGSEPYDACVVAAFRSADLPDPPVDLLVDDRLVTPRLAFGTIRR